MARLSEIGGSSMRSRKRLDEITELVSRDLYLTPFNKVLRKVRRLSLSNRNRLLELLKDELRTQSFSKESERVSLAKLLVAVYPLSQKLIEGSLFSKRGKNMREFHFSMFCYLDHIRELRPGSVPRICRLIGKYMEQSPRNDTAMATWMAGDLLGDHLPLKNALPILARVSQKAPHSHIRKAALHGLSHALNRSTKSGQLLEIKNLLTKISATDSNASVRRLAGRVLKRTEI